MDRYNERKSMVEGLVSGGCISKKEVLDAMLKVPRHEFIPRSQSLYAYLDRPLPIGSEQTISAPHMVAMMTEYLDLKKDHKILEIGAGSGYQAAVLSEIANKGRVITVERIKELAYDVKKKLKRLGYNNVEIIIADGTKGYEKEAPYDRIIVTAAAPKIPQSLIRQLKHTGKMLIPVGDKMSQELILIEKKDKKVHKKKLCSCVFVPLIGEEGW